MNPTKPTPTGNNPSDVQPGEDFEARFKGMQREYNKLHSDFEATQKALDAANAIVAGSGDALSAAQQEASKYRNELAALQNQLSEKDAALSKANTELTKHTARSAIRTKLVNQKAVDVLPFFEKGFLNFESDDDAAITSTIEAFREDLKNFGGVGSQQLEGSSVPNVTPADGGSLGKMNEEQMFNFLTNPANYGRPEYQSVQDQYDKLAKA